MKSKIAVIPIIFVSIYLLTGCGGPSADDVAVNSDVETLSPDNDKGRGLRAGTGGGGGTDASATDANATPVPSMPLDP